MKSCSGGNWGKLAAHISRAISVIRRDYDSVKIKRKLDELTEKVKELRDQDPVC